MIHQSMTREARHTLSGLLCGMLLTAAPAAWAQAASLQTASPAPPTAKPASLLDQSPAPPVIEFTGGRLTIHAANSSLRAILDDLGTRTGTRVEGLGRDERIFGVYGPGNPQEVLSALLDDSGYNVLIAGRKPDGSPREVVLSARAAAAPAPAQTAARTQAADENDDGDVPDTAPYQQPAPFIAPPQQNVPPPGQPAAGPQQVKTPQQMLEELQRLRQSTVPPGTQGAPPQ